MWIYGHILKIKKREVMPEGEYVIYGKGRMADALERGLKKANISYTLIDARVGNMDYTFVERNELCKEDEIEMKLLQANIANASVIIAGTRDDMINLAVIALAKKHNPDIYAISRENEIEDKYMFQAARVQRHYVVENIVIEKAYNYQAMPLAHILVEMISTQNEQWGKNLVDYIYSKMGERPLLYEIKIDKDSAYAVYHEIEKGTDISFGVLKRKREDYMLENDLIFLMVVRDDTPLLLPKDDYIIQKGDRFLVVCQDESRIDLEYILENYYELHYVIYGTEKNYGILSLLKKAVTK